MLITLRHNGLSNHHNDFFLYFIIIGCLILSFTSCKKNQGPPYYQVPEELKKECLFGQGSYWIFKNDSTGAIDSDYVDNNKPFVYDTIWYDYGSDECIINQVHSNVLYDTKLEVGPGESQYIGSLFTNIHAREIDFYCSWLNAFPLFNDTIVNHQGRIFVNCGSWKYPHYEGSNYYILEKFQGYKVNNLTFNEVKLTRSIYIPNMFSPYNKDTADFYFSPKNGFVKLVLHIDTSQDLYGLGRTIESWSLLRYSVKNY